jgi:hypothetical protein
MKKIDAFLRFCLPGPIPQVVAILRVDKDRSISLRKAVRDYLGLGDRVPATLFIRIIQGEVILSNSGGGQGIVVDGKRIRLPGDVSEMLGLGEGSMVAFIEREGDLVAIKKIEVVEKEGERARIVDLETTFKITRIALTNPMPETLLPRLKRQHENFKLRHDVKRFLKNRQTFEAWKARRILNMAESTDEELRRKLVEQRLQEQLDDDSWEGQVPVTARNLRELADLGMRKDDDEIRLAVSWLMKRPQSRYNPGMFFVTDDLAEEQEELIERREKQTKGARERFRELRGSEIRLVKAGDDLIGKPCGPRIMWPNALVLEALLKLGYEENARVQANLRTLMLSKTGRSWCECGYQHGLTGLRKEPCSMQEIERIERDSIEQFRYGGISSVRELETRDMVHRSGERMPRVAHESAGEAEGGVDEYPLRMPSHLQGCELMTARALSQIRDEKMRRLAEAHLWRFAGRQQSADGRFTGKYPEKYFRLSQAGYLDLFARYDHPVSRIAIMRTIPWIINNQNEDGSWGDTEEDKDTSTLSVITALKRVELV